MENMTELEMLEMFAYHLECDLEAALAKIKELEGALYGNESLHD